MINYMFITSSNLVFNNVCWFWFKFHMYIIFIYLLNIFIHLYKDRCLFVCLFCLLGCDYAITLSNHEGPSLLLVLPKKPSMTRCARLFVVVSLFSDHVQTNGAKIIEFRVVFVSKIKINF